MRDYCFIPCRAIQKKLINREADLIQNQSCYNVYKQWLQSLDVDGMFTVTPFLQEIELIARLLKKENKKIIASIHSFDNITTRQWPALFYDHYLVWNSINKAELERINIQLKESNAITICGSAQFDFHYNNDFSWTRDEWLRKLGLPNDKKIILYAGGPVSIFKDEPQYLLHLKEAFEDGILDHEDAIILFRSHPLDKKERWHKLVGDSDHIIYDAAQSGHEKFDHINVTKDNIRKLISTLKYSDVHINMVSTMAIDGSVFNKPQIGPYYTEIDKGRKQEPTRKMYWQEHYLPIKKSGAVNLAYSKQQFIHLVKDALYNPSTYTRYCQDCVETMITYTDGKTTDRVVDAVRNFYSA